MDLVFATNNKNKLFEAKSLLGDKHRILSLKDISCNIEIPEDFDTLEANATQKAEIIHNKFAWNIEKIHYLTCIFSLCGCDNTSTNIFIPYIRHYFCYPII